MQNSDKSDYKTTVKPLEGIADYPHWRQNAKAYLTRKDPLLLGLKDGPQGEGLLAENKWKEANAQAKATLTILLSTPVQIRAITICNDETKTASELWQFLESTYTASNEQAIQNLQVQLDKLVYVEGPDWDSHIN